MISVNYDIDGVATTNPFHRVRLRDTAERQRKPFTSNFIRDVLLKSGALDGLKPELALLVRLLINTGVRPSEAIGLEMDDFCLDAPIPYIHIRKNTTRQLKTAHSERMIPLVGIRSGPESRLRQRVVWWHAVVGVNGLAKTCMRRAKSTNISGMRACTACAWCQIRTGVFIVCAIGFRIN